MSRRAGGLPNLNFTRCRVLDPAALGKPAIEFIERSNGGIAAAQFSFGPGFPIERFVGLGTVQIDEGIVFLGGFLVIAFIQSLLAFVVKLLLTVEFLLFPIPLLLFTVALFLFAISPLVVRGLSHRWFR